MTIEQLGIVSLLITQAGRICRDYLKERKHDRNDIQRDTTLAHIKKTGDETHTLSNSGMGAQLKAYSLIMKMYYLALKRIADLTALTADIDAASKALDDWVESVKILERHQSKEAQAYKIEQPAWDGPTRRSPVPPVPEQHQEGIR
jgi:hypothetical protein